jgi:hypothetical protein
MATRTTYTSTITVPVYASWKCEECGEINIATGVIACKRQETTSSWRPSKQREAEEKAAQNVQAEWVGETYNIISDPNKYAQDMFLRINGQMEIFCGMDGRMDYITIPSMAIQAPSDVTSTMTTEI